MMLEADLVDLERVVLHVMRVAALADELPAIGQKTERLELAVALRATHEFFIRERILGGLGRGVGLCFLLRLCDFALVFEVGAVFADVAEIVAKTRLSCEVLAADAAELCAWRAVEMRGGSACVGSDGLIDHRDGPRARSRGLVATAATKTLGIAEMAAAVGANQFVVDVGHRGRW